MLSFTGSGDDSHGFPHHRPRVEDTNFLRMVQEIPMVVKMRLLWHADGERRLRQTGRAGRRKVAPSRSRHRCSARSRSFGTPSTDPWTGEPACVGVPFRNRTGGPRFANTGGAQALRVPAENRGRQSVASRVASDWPPAIRSQWSLCRAGRRTRLETGKSCDFGRRQCSRLFARQPFEHRIRNNLFELYCRASLSWRTVSRCWLPSSA